MDISTNLPFPLHWSGIKDEVRQKKSVFSDALIFIGVSCRSTRFYGSTYVQRNRNRKAKPIPHSRRITPAIFFAFSPLQAQVYS